MEPGKISLFVIDKRVVIAGSVASYHPKKRPGNAGPRAAQGSPNKAPSALAMGPACGIASGGLRPEENVIFSFVDVSVNMKKFRKLMDHQTLNGFDGHWVFD
jgi:hypothetical protein